MVAVKIDVDTLQGYNEGVPRLADLLQRLGIPATFCIAMGPDRSGRAIRRIWRHRGFLSKMLRTGAGRIYSWRTRLYGLLLPAPPIAASRPHAIADLLAAGFEVIPHGWDHVSWHDFLTLWPPERVHSELVNACLEFQRRAGVPCYAFAAPGWQATETSIAIEESLGLEYAADTRGWCPFFPVLSDGRVCRVLQLPTTLPTADELIGRPGMTPQTMTATLLELFRKAPQIPADAASPPPRLVFGSRPAHVFTAHAEIEGGPWLEWFVGLLEALISEGAEFVTLRQMARRALDAGAVPACRVVNCHLPGRAGTVSCQSCGPQPAGPGARPCAC